jgi:hypothetical protein
MFHQKQNRCAVAQKGGPAGKAGAYQLWKRFVTVLLRALGAVAW